MTVNILGADYKISTATAETDKFLENADGYCDRSTKQIVILDVNDPYYDFEIKDRAWYRRKVLRHEIVHAFLFESGIGECFEWDTKNAHNEAVVDWIATQGTKLMKSWKEAGCLE